MFGRRTSDSPEPRPVTSAAGLAAAPLTAGGIETAHAGRAFGRRKDDATIRVMHMPKQSAPESGDASRTSAPPPAGYDLYLPFPLSTATIDNTPVQPPASPAAALHLPPSTKQVVAQIA